MKTEQLRRAIGGIDPELIEAADRSPGTARSHRPRRVTRAALIAAVLALLLSLSAVAVYVISHEKTAALMEAGPMSSGRLRPQIDEAGTQIIEEAALDLGISQESNGTTVTLDSLMGFQDPVHSLVYLTFTITPPQGYEFPEDMSLWCFWDYRFALVPDDMPIPYAASTVKNPDGTASVLWAIEPVGNPENHRLHIDISGGFGMADKVVVESLYNGSRQIELPGQWTFDLDLPSLPETREIPLDAQALETAGLPLTALRLNHFGGILEVDRSFPDWQPQTLSLVYPDGREYTVSYGTYGDNLWPMYEETGFHVLVLFLAPQPLEEAAEVVIDGVHIPLK